MALVDALGCLARFVLLAGQRHDSIGDKAFDSDWIRAKLDERGAMAVIPPKADRARSVPCDFAISKWRYLVENFFCNLKEFNPIATRYDQTDTSFAAAIHLVGSYLATK